MKRALTRRWRGKLALSVATVFCSAIALLAGALPAGATQSQATILATAITMSQVSVQTSATRATAPEGCLPAVAKFDRFDACWEDHWGFLFTEDGIPVGSLEAVVIQSIHLSSTRKEFQEDDIVDSAVDLGITAPVNIDMGASCESPCHADAHFSGVLADGLRGTVDYTDDITKDHHHETATRYTLDYEAPPFVKSGDFTPWDSPVSYRCDNGEAASNSTGCVFPKDTPKLILSIGRYGASAAMVQFAQENMSEHWGLQGEGKELTRQADASTVNSNRARICDSTFKNKGKAIGGPDDKDSCDEFPFAGTNQSGASALGGKTGAACQQVTAIKSKDSGTEAAQWSGIRVLHPIDLSAPCVRGHIPLNLNTGAGSAYGNFIKDERLINDDGFWLEVTD